MVAYVCRSCGSRMCRYESVIVDHFDVLEEVGAPNGCAQTKSMYTKSKWERVE